MSRTETLTVPSMMKYIAVAASPSLKMVVPAVATIGRRAVHICVVASSSSDWKSGTFWIMSLYSAKTTMLRSVGGSSERNVSSSMMTCRAADQIRLISGAADKKLLAQGFQYTHANARSRSDLVRVEVVVEVHDRRGDLRPELVDLTAGGPKPSFWLLSSLHAHTKPPYKRDLLPETLRPRKRPGRARTVQNSRTSLSFSSYSRADLRDSRTIDVSVPRIKPYRHLFVH
jgi:hypothetical protein